jgi:hypothetical protein
MIVRILCLSAALALAAAPALAEPAASEAATPAGAAGFDWEIGTWTTVVKVRRNPLSGTAPDWAEYRGTSVVRPLMDGRANFVDLAVSGAAGTIEGGSLRLFNPTTGQWSLNYASANGGELTAPVYGGFDAAGRGLFYGQDRLGGRVILVRFVITRISADEARFEQAYSADGGTSWEDNWIAVDTRRPAS